MMCLLVLIVAKIGIGQVVVFDTEKVSILCVQFRYILKPEFEIPLVVRGLPGLHTRGEANKFFGGKPELAHEASEVDGRPPTLSLRPTALNDHLLQRPNPGNTLSAAYRAGSPIMVVFQLDPITRLHDHCRKRLVVKVPILLLKPPLGGSDERIDLLATRILILAHRPLHKRKEVTPKLAK